MLTFEAGKTEENTTCKRVRFENFVLHNNQELLPEAFSEIVQQLAVYQGIKDANSIILKPNLAGGSSVSSQSHAVTDTKLLRAVVEGIRRINKNAMIYIAESDSAGAGFAFLKFENQGLDKWRLHNVKLLDLSRDRLSKITLKNTRYFSDVRPLWISETLLNADLIISLANLKTHSVTMYTGACKNLFGLLPREDKYIYHPSIDDVINDIVTHFTPSLSIVDGFRAMEQNGPIIGKQINLSLRIFSSNPVVADIVGCQLIGINYRRVKHLRLLSKHRERPETKNLPCFRIRHRSSFLTFSNFLGLLIQRIGESIFMFGHRIHNAESISLFIMMAVRPILLIFFDIGTLKRWKRKYFK